MKALFIFFLLTLLLPAKTWIELAKEADYHRDHPGRLITVPEDDPQRLEYLELQAETVQEILAGEPAVLPVDPLDWEEESPTGHLLTCLVDLSQLTTLQAKRQEWKEVNALLDLARKARKRILASEPSFIWFLIAKAPSQTAFQCLNELSAVEVPAKREALFAILKSHWHEFRPTRADFAITEKGETRYARRMTRDYKTFLRSQPFNLEAPPVSWDEDFPHQLSIREVLELPLDDKQFRKDTLDDLKKEYQWIRSGEPIDELRKTFNERPPRDLNFYRTHANGLGEIMRDATPPHQNATMMIHQLERIALKEVAWHWLSLERTGEEVTRADQVINVMPESLKKDLETFKIELLPNGRLITAPDEIVFGQKVENRLTVPDLFPN